MDCNNNGHLANLNYHTEHCVSSHPSAEMNFAEQPREDRFVYMCVINQTLPRCFFWWNALIKEGACLKNALCWKRTRSCLGDFGETWDVAGEPYVFFPAVADWHWICQRPLPHCYSQAAERDITWYRSTPFACGNPISRFCFFSWACLSFFRWVLCLGRELFTFCHCLWEHGKPIRFIQSPTWSAAALS